MIKQRAEQLRDGVMRSRGHALLPIMLASFIYDALDVPSTESILLIVDIHVLCFVAFNYVYRNKFFSLYINRK